MLTASSAHGHLGDKHLRRRFFEMEQLTHKYGIAVLGAFTMLAFIIAVY